MTYPTIMPAITLDFQNSQQLDPRVKFSRSSSATYINSAGQVASAADHEARFDHDPVTGENLGLLMEESRTNYAENSEDFSLWTAQNSTVLTAQGTAPNGTNTAFKIQENTSNISHSIREPTNSTWSGAATISCYVKPAGRNFAYMGFTGVSQTSVTFDLVNKVSSYKGNNVTSASVKEAGNGWVRIIAVFSSSITSGRATVGPAESDSSGGLNYVGDGSSGILAWGAQLETGAFPTSYIPTTGSTVTRSADICKIDGYNFSSWYNQSKGTITYKYTAIGGGQFLSPASIRASNGQDVQSWGYYMYTGGSQYRVPNAGQRKSPTENIHLADSIFTSTVMGQSYKAAVTHDNSTLSGCLQGYSVQSRSITSLPTMTELGIGYIKKNWNNYFTGHVTRLSYYNQRLTDAELQTITQ